MKTLKKQWFSVAIFGVISIAYLISKLNLELSDYYLIFVKFSLIIGIFLLSGLTVESKNLFHSIKHWRLHLWIQVISFLLFPLLVIGTAYLLVSLDSNNLIYVGFVVLACIPTTITSCVVFTRNAGGNEECALFNATLGNILGIFLTPLLIYLLIGQNIELDPNAAIKKLSILIVLPFTIGQVCRNLFSVKINSSLAKSSSDWMILGIMLIAFINAFQQGIDLEFREFIYIVVLCLLLKVSLMAVTWYSSGLMTVSFSLADRKCLAITATQKTLALGLPIITVLFAENPNLALISLPIIAYYTIQLFIDKILAGVMSEIAEEIP